MSSPIRGSILKAGTSSAEPAARAPAAPAAPAERVLGIKLSPLTRRRLRNFRANRRGFWSLWIFLALFGVSLFAELIANDKPLLIRYQGSLYFPIAVSYPETAFGGEFPTEADYRDPFVIQKIRAAGWMIWPLVPYSYQTVNRDLNEP